MFKRLREKAIERRIWKYRVDFINSRLDDELLDKMVKDGTLREN